MQNISLDNSIKEDKNKILFKQLPFVIGLNVPLVAILAWIYWPLVNHHLIISWSALMFIIMLMRVGLILKYPKPFNDGNLSGFQENFVVFNSVLSGVMWGWAGVLFFVPNQLEYQLIIFFILVFKAAGSISAVTSYLRSFYYYLPLSMLPISIMFFLEGTRGSFWLAILSLGYLVVILIFGKNLSETLLESLRLRYENSNLLQDLTEQKDKAEHANEAKSRFLAAASHDLRQPIHALTLLSSVLEQKIKEPESRKILEQLISSVSSLETLLSTLLDISQLDARAVLVNKDHFSLGLMLQRLMNDFLPEAQEKGLLLSTSENDFMVFSDSKLVEQILRNLISNAIRYTKSGQVDVLLEQVEEHIQISVIDTGIGISDEQKDKVFNEFYQVENVQRDRSLGLGLGLSIVKRVARLLEIKVLLTSEVGKGSKFSFNLEKSSHSTLDSQIFKQEEQSSITLFDFEVALLEDDTDAGVAMETLLESWGSSVTLAVSSIKLLESYTNKNIKPAVIISDLQLADNENGVDAIKKIKSQLDLHCPHLIITGNTQAEVLSELKNSGFHYLIKPASPAKLRAFLIRAKISLSSNN